MNYPLNYHRRQSSVVHVGDINIGGASPVRIQSMANTDTNDICGSVAQAKRIINAGGELVRFTTQGAIQVENLRIIRQTLREQGINTPIVADVHFQARVADLAAQYVDKVRINPGNYIDPARQFKSLQYTDEEYRAELQRLEERFTALLSICRKHGTALRLGVNHGSLSDRIMSRYGDTSEGMVESVMEFLRICKRQDFGNVVISVKASNTVVMLRTMRLLARQMEREGMAYPLHLGVTEAGDAEDGRIKSAVGIGALLADGIGDTIRVSLSEAPENEIPVARAILEHIDTIAAAPKLDDDIDTTPHPTGVKAIVMPDDSPTLPDGYALLESTHQNPIGEIRRAVSIMRSQGDMRSVVVKRQYNTADPDLLRIQTSIDMGSLLIDGFIDGLQIEAPNIEPQVVSDTAFSILQATRRRITKTEYIACPGCGRTMFDLQSTLQRIKAATAHLKGLKIGVMGCIVNGPGEMADADYGYVGAARGCVSLYKGKQCIEKNIPEDQAVERLLKLISKE